MNDIGQETQLEVEVKFLVDDLSALRAQVQALGATQKRERVFEHNVRFDTAEETLLQRDELLRLREDTAVSLTFKGPTPAAQNSEAKVREELEVTVSDFATMRTLLQRLGFEPVQVYDKYRETFHLDDVEIVLDELPYGNFVELEGKEEAIKPLADRLGLDWAQRITTDYLTLMAQLRQYHDLPFADLTFANFQDTTARVSDIIES